MCSHGSLVGEVDGLSRIDVSAMPVAGLQDFVATATSAIGRLTGLRSRALGELQVRGGGQVPDRDGQVCPTPAWLRQVANVTGTEAGRQIRTSVALRELPLVSDAVVDGLISPEHARILTGLVGKIDPQALSDSQPALIEVATRTDPSQLASYIRHLLATWCEPDLEAEEAAAEERRFFTFRDQHNGSWRGSFELPDAAMEIVRTALEPLARRDGNADSRTAGQRRADALSDVFGLALRYADLPDAGGYRPLLTYLMPSLAVAPTASATTTYQADPADPADRLTSSSIWTGIRGRTARPGRGPDRPPAPSSTGCSATPGSSASSWTPTGRSSPSPT